MHKEVMIILYHTVISRKTILWYLSSWVTNQKHKHRQMIDTKDHFREEWLAWKGNTSCDGMGHRYVDRYSLPYSWKRRSVLTYEDQAQRSFGIGCSTVFQVLRTVANCYSARWRKDLIWVAHHSHSQIINHSFINLNMKEWRHTMLRIHTLKRWVDTDHINTNAFTRKNYLNEWIVTSESLAPATSREDFVSI